MTTMDAAAGHSGGSGAFRFSCTNNNVFQIAHVSEVWEGLGRGINGRLGLQIVECGE